ncbi:hypothetical protein [Kitasatospora sp. NPDC059571]|uniref:hypothetical protein n=1 Tax=Kitasatospora sp. NPDC059571 TaxID=3346871 RepID=UPI0036C5F1FF
MESHSSVYEARYGWYRRSVVAALISLLPLALGLALQLPAWCVVLFSVAFGGLGVITTVVVASSRRVAVRMDDRGVTLGRVPLPTGSRELSVPWEDIELVRVWQPRIGSSTFPKAQYISLERRAGSPPLTGHPDLFRPSNVAEELPPASKKLSWCELDPARLQAAVTAFAPEVRLVLEG